MSETRVYTFLKDGKREKLVLRNSHGFGPHIWSSLCVRYLNSEAAWLFDHAFAEKLCPLLTSIEWFVLQLPGDGNLIAAKDLQLASALVMAFDLEHKTVDGVNHLPVIAEHLLKLSQRDDVEAVGFWTSNVSADFWDKSDETVYDLHKDTGHCFISVGE